MIRLKLVQLTDSGPGLLSASLGVLVSKFREYIITHEAFTVTILE